MKCPYCKSDQDRVIETRSIDGGEHIRRRRSCQACGKRFSSIEIVEEVRVRVIKKSGEKENFDIDKVIRSVELACRKRNITQEQKEDLLWKVERESLQAPDNEISSSTIGELIIRELRELDPVAFVRFSSVYRDYQDVDQFIEDLSALREKNNPIVRKKKS